MFTFSLPYFVAVKLAKKLAHSVDTRETRYYMCGFFLHKADDGKHYAVSTNGHIMTRLEIVPEYDGEFPAVIFPTEALKQIERMKPDNKKRSVVTFRVDPKIHFYEIDCELQRAGGKLIDGNYPDYTRCIPSGWRSYTNEYGGVGFSPIYLASIMKAASYDANTFKASSDGVRIFFEKEGPAVITEVKDSTVHYVIMPTRGGDFHEHKEPDGTLAA